MALHEQSVGATDEWYTPPHVFDALGCKFDTDVASPGADITPWIPTKHFITRHDKPIWCGFIWMNPPFGGRNGLVPWLQNFFEHGNGIALVPDRTSAPWWQRFARMADSILFVTPKLKFIGIEMSRIVTGDPEYLDNWDDIGGYARIVADRIRAKTTPVPRDRQP